MSIPEAQVPEFLIAEQVVVYNSVAAGAFILWDHCITFGQEVELVWKSRFSIVNFLFLVIRYLTLVTRVVYFVFYPDTDNIVSPSVATCVKWLWFNALSGQIIFSAVEVLLIIRVFALYERNKFILVCLIAGFLVETASELVIVGIVVPGATIIPSAFPHSLDPRACILLGVPRIFNNFWVPGLIYESILFLLVAVRFGRAKRQRDGLDDSHILIVLVRDGTWAFILLFALLLWASLTYELSTQKGDIALTWIYSVLAFCGTRLTLNLRVVAEDQRDLDTSIEFNIREPLTVDTVATFESE